MKMKIVVLGSLLCLLVTAGFITSSYLQAQSPFPVIGCGFPRPDFDSGWVSMGQNSSVTLYHYLSENPDDYFVDLQFKDDGAYGINNIYIGGDNYMAAPGFLHYGGHYSNLTDTSIEIYRKYNDKYADFFRVRIWLIR